MLGSHHVAWADLVLSILVFCYGFFFFLVLLLNFVFWGRLQGQRAAARGGGDERRIEMHDGKSTKNQ